MVDCEGVSLGSSCAKLPHSHSAEISKTPPPGAPKNPGKMLAIRVQMLDDNVTLFQVQAKALGRVLFEQVCKQLNLLEADYFGLEYKDHNGTKYWLDNEKPLSRQVGLSLVEPMLYFCVKFYTPDPAQLEEEYTRYLFCLQIKRDLAQGHIQCNDNTAALMASYIVQAECGDYVPEDYPDASYLSSYKFVQHQDRELEKKIMENHKKHAGQSPAEADLNLLETARRCELYGMKMHPVKDHEGVPLNLAVAHMGIVVYQGYTKIYTFSWAKVRKISFKRKKFLIKLHPDGYACKVLSPHDVNGGIQLSIINGYYKDTVEFFFESRNECKNLWKKCVENHGFFRCNSIKRVPRQRTRVLSRGSSFRYSGKTQKQMVEFVRENYVKRQNFQRSQSFRQSSSVHSSVATNVGGSISAHPLIPLGDNSIVSVSCGSMVLAGVDSPSRISPVDRMNQTHSSPLTFRDQRQRTVAVVEVEEGRNESPKSEKRILNSTPNHIYSNNVNIVTSTPKVNGYPISPMSELNSPELSPYKTLKDKGPGSADTLDGEVKKKRSAADKAYFIAKEFLMTERTYRKDLEVINLWLRDEFDKTEERCISHLLRIIDPLHDAHCELLKDVEQRLQTWETRGANHHRIADILLSATQYYSLYEDYLHEHQDVLTQLSKDLCNDAFEETYTGFEKNKICYLPLTLFILKPIQRLLHYNHLVDRLKKHYGPEHPDYAECEDAARTFEKLVKQVPEVLHVSENYVQLIELGRDLSGFEGTLTEGGRQFIRQGCLGKFSQRKGFQQRMFFLLSDMVLYSKLSGQTFKVHGQMPVKSLTVEERVDNPSPNSFTIYSGTRAITVSAATPEEKDKWLEDLTCTIDTAKNCSIKTSLLSLKCSSSTDDVNEKANNEEVVRASPQRSNTTVHVCWHRNTSISLKDQIRAAENQLSGYLLRKFKNSNGWQKLWVVFTNFCLFFYKTFQDDAPLASLPLLGYSVTTPNEKDNINKDFVFKLQFKNHIYFFRAESEYTFSRWMEVIGSATLHSGRTRLFSRKDSSLEHIS